jgi:hypothetical protein
MTHSTQNNAGDLVLLPTVHAEPRLEVNQPSYRVNFWSRVSRSHAWNLDAFIFFRASGFSEVLDWAEKEGQGRQFEIYVEIDEEPYTSFATPRTTALVRLHGNNPNLATD